MNKLIFANLLHRPVRSIISVLAVAIEVIMILSIVGVFMGMLNDSKQRENGIGADLTVRPPNSSFMVGVSGAPMPIKFAAALRKLDHVAVASPVNSKFVTTGKIEVIDGIDYDSFNALKPFVYLSGGPFKGPDDVIVDDVFAGSGKGYHVGDTIKILDHDFHISGIVEHGKGARKLIPLDTMDQITDAEGKASLFYIKCDNPADDNAVMQEIHATRGLEDYPVETVDAWLEEMTPDKLPGFNIALDVVRFIAVVVGFLAIFQSMYTAVLERTREIGILKSMGASKLTIVDVVLRETAAMALIGVTLGIAATFGIKILIVHVFPTQHFEITGLWIAKGAAIAFVGALCGALYPAWMAARKDPIDALAYE
ncbi:MAG TPA: FtsX-like permease family protein [Terracidiphilus sp.]|jgi:putative ABC transport system permease protein